VQVTSSLIRSFSWEKLESEMISAILKAVGIGGNTVREAFKELGKHKEFIKSKQATILLHAVADLKLVDLVKILLENGFSMYGLLSKMVSLNSLYGVNYLISCGADTNETINGKTPLHYATITHIKDPATTTTTITTAFTTTVTTAPTQPFSPNIIIGTKRITRIEIVKLLIQSGANVNTLDDTGNSPLHYACKFNRKDLAEILTQNGAHVNVRNHLNETPLFVAVDSGSQDVFDMLIDYKGIEVYTIDSNGCSILNCACKLPEITPDQIAKKHAILDELEQKSCNVQ